MAENAADRHANNSVQLSHYSSFEVLNTSFDLINEAALPSYSLMEKVSLVTATALFCLTGLIGNLAVIVVICRDHVIKRRRHYLYLMSLAVSDLSLLTLVVPLSLANEIADVSSFSIHVCRFHQSLDVLLCTASIWTIVLIAIDRYMAISHPANCQRFRSIPRIRALIIGVWMFSAIVSVMPLIGDFRNINGQKRCFINDSAWYIVLSTWLSFFMPACIALTVHLKICNIGRKLRRRRNTLHTLNKASQRVREATFRRERRLMLVISLVMGCFMVCWSPFFVTYLAHGICGTSCSVNIKLLVVFFWFGYLNSAINPIIYTIFNKDFKKAFKKLIRRRSVWVGP